MSFRAFVPITLTWKAAGLFSNPRKNQEDMAKVVRAFELEGVHIYRNPFDGDHPREAISGAVLGHHVAQASNELLAVATTLGPASIAALGGWLAGRNGRKVRIKVGDIEVEANTQAGVEKLLARALEVKQNAEPSKIVKP